MNRTISIPALTYWQCVWKIVKLSLWFSLAEIVGGVLLALATGGAESWWVHQYETAISVIAAMATGYVMRGYIDAP